MTRYQYKPLRFYAACFSATWAFWIAAAVTGRSESDGGISMVFMLLGLVYVLNFLISVVPMGFLAAWVYVKNNRSMPPALFFICLSTPCGKRLP